jgi:hypothetical protein
LLLLHHYFCNMVHILSKKETKKKCQYFALLIIIFTTLLPVDGIVKCNGPLRQWPRSLRCGFAAIGFLELWVQILPGAWMSVSCVCCVLSGRGLCVGLITCPEESYQLWCVWAWSWSLDNEEALAY